VLFGELVRLSYQIRSVGVPQGNPGTIPRQGVPGLAGNRWLPQSGSNKTNAKRVAWLRACSSIEVSQRGSHGKAPPAGAAWILSPYAFRRFSDRATLTYLAELLPAETQSDSRRACLIQDQSVAGSA
jgi:hypothetical protein